MNYIVSVYSREAFREFILPSIRDADYELVLGRDVFGLSSDITLRLEIIGDSWRVKPAREYRIFREEENRESGKGQPRRVRREIISPLLLPFQGMLRLVSSDGETLSIFSGISASPLKAFEKYDIRGIDHITVGKDPENMIRIEGQETVSGQHAVLFRKGNDWYVECPGLNGLYLNGRILKGSRTLAFGSVLNVIGLRMVFLGDSLAVDAARPGITVNEKYLPKRTERPAGRPDRATDARSGSSRIVYHRSPRDTGRIETGSVSIEAPPPLVRRAEKPLLVTISPALLMLIPAALGCVLLFYAALTAGDEGPGWILYTGLGIIGCSILAGVLWAAGLVRNSRYEDRVEEHRHYEAYSAYLVRKAGEIRSLYEQNAASLRATWPDAASLALRDASSPSLWNCSSRQEDFLRCRLGSGSMDFQVEISVPETVLTPDTEIPTENPALLKENFRKLYDVPVLVDLRKHPVIGLVGGAGKRGAYDVARILSTQLAATHCYTDVKLGYIYDRNASDDAGQWDFARWLPHVWSGDHRIRYVASDRESVSEVCYELARVFRGRTENRDAGRIPKPWYVLFVSDISLIEDELLARFLLDPAPGLGLTVMILADTVDHLPMACEFIIENDDKYRGMFNVSRRKEEMTEITFDRVAPALLEGFARTLSNISVQETEQGGEIPAQLTFYEMYGIRNPLELKAEERWLKNRTSDNIRALIGQKAGGVPCYLDMHEKYHGPHALIAGTTGSGKSEMLQTYILSLAVNYSPEDVSFFIIDYKGGGMANLFRGLPHLAGSISNLSGNQVRRAMISVKSENRRRQRIFGQYGVNHIDQYSKLRKNGEAAEAVPHLFIVIDEFAELRKEEPEFMKELISVAQVGRSLGVHLILATQKPEGTVDENIRSNAKARLCLRVESREDSMDMLGKPDAAYLTRAGRCWMQVGSDEVYELFQSGWSGAPAAASSGAEGDGSVRLLDITGRTDMSASSAGSMHVEPAAEPGGPDETQFMAVKDYLCEIAFVRGMTGGHPLWLPILPEKLYLEDLVTGEGGFDGSEWVSGPEDGRAGCAVGLMDDPENQQRELLRLSFPAGGHHAVYGSSGSGKSTFLETALVSLMMTHTPEELSVYILDFGGGTLSAFAQAPHTGGVVQEGEDEKTAKLIHMLSSILEERKKAVRTDADRSRKANLPTILVVIDNYASFREKTADAWERTIEIIGREGSRHGICLLITAGTSGSAGIPGRLSDHMKTVICLEMPERHLYYELLRSREISVLPEAGVKGRGLAASRGRVLEFQTALSVRAADDYRRLEAVAGIARSMRTAWTGERARSIPMIPEKPEWESFAALPEVKAAFADPGKLPAGYDEKTAGVYSIDLKEVFCWLITGAARSGKTNFMRVMISSAAEKGADIGIYDPDGEMDFAKEKDGATLLKTEEDLFRYSTDILAPAFKARNAGKHALDLAGAGEEELFAASLGEKPMFFFIADFDRFIRTVYGNTRGLSGFMETLFLKGRFHNIYFAAILPDRSRQQLLGYRAYEIYTSYGTGVHFGGNPSKDPVLAFDNLGYADRTKVLRPGIGLIPEANGEHQPERIIIPLARFRKTART